MLYKSYKAGVMQPVQWSLLLLATFTILFSSCRPVQTTRVDRQLVAKEIPLARALIKSPSQSQPENNECLDCHSDRDRLIETAKPEELAEAESKGVG
jgi:hypothetical protein